MQVHKRPAALSYTDRREATIAYFKGAAQQTHYTYSQRLQHLQNIPKQPSQSAAQQLASHALRSAPLLAMRHKTLTLQALSLWLEYKGTQQSVFNTTPWHQNSAFLNDCFQLFSSQQELAHLLQLTPQLVSQDQMAHTSADEALLELLFLLYVSAKSLHQPLTQYFRLHHIPHSPVSAQGLDQRLSYLMVCATSMHQSEITASGSSLTLSTTVHLLVLQIVCLSILYCFSNHVPCDQPQVLQTRFEEIDLRLQELTAHLTSLSATNMTTIDTQRSSSAQTIENLQQLQSHLSPIIALIGAQSTQEVQINDLFLPY